MRALNRFTVEHPVWTLLIVAVLSGLLGWLAARIEFSTDLQDMLPAEDPTIREYVEASFTYGSQDYLLIAITAEPTVFQAHTLRVIWELTSALEALPEEWVEEVRSFFNAEVIRGTATALIVEPAADGLPRTPEGIERFRQTVLGERLLRRLFLSPDETTALIIIEERVEIVDSEEEVALTQAVEELVRPFQVQGPEVIRISGGPYITAQIQSFMVEDLAVLIPLAVAILLIVLFASFRHPHGMLLPLAVVLLSVLWTLGLMTLVGFRLTIVSVAMPVVLIAIGNADGIHLLTRYQEALGAQADSDSDRRRALREALAGLNAPIIYTSFTSAAGFLGLSSSYSVVIKEFGIATAAGILVAMVLSLTFLPAVLALLPAPRARVQTRRLRGLSVSGRWSAFLARRAGRIVILAFVVLVVSLLGIPRLEINNNPLDYFRPDLPVVRFARFVERTFGGSLTLRITLGTDRPNQWVDPDWLRRVQAFQVYLEGLPHVGLSTSLVDLVREINTSLHGDDPAYDAIPQEARAVAQGLLLFSFGGGGSLEGLVRPNYTEGQIIAAVESVRLRELKPLVEEIRGQLEERFPEARFAITGAPIFGLRLGETLIPSQVESLLLSLFLVWVMLLAFTRSLRLSLIGVAPLLFAVGIEFGLMGYAGVALDLGTAMVASVAIGIGVDFAIHFTARYRRERQTNPPSQAVERVLRTTGRALLFNTLSLGLGFAALLLSRFTANIAFGLLVGITVLIAFSTTLGLVPALLMLTSKPSRV